MVFWNLVLCVLVSVPVHLVATFLELRLRGESELKGQFFARLGNAAASYEDLLVPIALGALVHGLAMRSIPETWTRGAQAVAAVLLATLLPLTVDVLRSSGGPVFKTFPGAGVLATLAYGTSSAAVRPVVYANNPG